MQEISNKIEKKNNEKEKKKNLTWVAPFFLFFSLEKTYISFHYGFTDFFTGMIRKKTCMNVIKVGE